LNKIRITDVLTVLNNIQVPIYSMGIPNQKREIIGYSVTFCMNGINVKLKGNPGTKKYQKILNEYGEIVRDTLLQAFEGQVIYNSLNEFIVKESKD
jgi:hypothetical protein